VYKHTFCILCTTQHRSQFHTERNAEEEGTSSYCSVNENSYVTGKAMGNVAADLFLAGR
jgi:hypothetical protein